MQAMTKKGRSTKIRPARGASPAPKLKMPDFSHSLPMLLLRGREAVMRHFRPSLLEHGVTEQQWRVLRALNSVDEMEVLMLANATYLFASSMSRILKDLQRRGLISRRNDSRDLRRNLVAISPKGRELIATLSPTSEAIYNDIYQRFGRKNFNTLQGLLLELEAKLEAEGSAAMTASGGNALPGRGNGARPVGQSRLSTVARG
jgi:homoprotocatechuate degradation regulator HpaR